MKLKRAWISFAAFAALALRLAADTATADADWQAYQTAIAPAPAILQLAPLEQRRALARREETIAQTARTFFDAHPDDPRRWDAALMLSRLSRSFLLNPDAVKIEDLKYDTAAQRAWRQEAPAWRQKILAAADAPESARAGAEADIFQGKAQQAFEALKTNAVFDLAPLRAELDALMARHPAASAMRAPVDTFVRLSARQNPAAPDSLWREFAQSANPAVREQAAKALLMIDAKAKPLELSFTAFDGREVDLAKLRGKVVLIDFWATWCGPCVAELPNVKRVYDAYHDRGFEVIGVSLDLEHDRQKLAAFLKERGMPWPQHFDGKSWHNELAVKYGITAVPAMFLLDKSGKVVSTDARGEKLEPAVKRLLGL